MYKGIERIKNDLEYGKHMYDSLITLYNCRDMDMLIDNKDRVLNDIKFLEKALNNMKELVENL